MNLVAQPKRKKKKREENRNEKRKQKLNKFEDDINDHA